MSDQGYPFIANDDLRFRDELRIQRFDDHRYYHQNRINQSLHLVSAMSFMAAYVLMFTNLTAAVMWRIWRFLPSRSLISNQDVGPCGVTGLERGGRPGSGMRRTFAGRVVYPLSLIPFSN